MCEPPDRTAPRPPTPKPQERNHRPAFHGGLLHGSLYVLGARGVVLIIVKQRKQEKACGQENVVNSARNKFCKFSYSLSLMVCIVDFLEQHCPRPGQRWQTHV